MKSKKLLTRAVALAVTGLLSACMTMPAQLNLPVTPLSLGEVRAAKVPNNHQVVRWGGVIAAVENHSSDTWIELVEQPLNEQGRPMMVDRSGGRFMVKIPGFVDPSIYAKGRELTVVGNLDGSFRATIGKDYHYDYPVVAATSHYLWPPRVERDTYYVEPAFPYWGPYPYYGGPWGYDPFWGPRYRVDVRHPSNQPGPGPVPGATPPHVGSGPSPLPSPPPTSNPPRNEPPASSPPSHRSPEQPQTHRRPDDQGRRLEVVP